MPEWLAPLIELLGVALAGWAFGSFVFVFAWAVFAARVPNGSEERKVPPWPVRYAMFVAFAAVAVGAYWVTKRGGAADSLFLSFLSY